MEAPFLEGVQYFSREEEATARRLRDERAVYTDIDIDRDDLESLKFVKAVSDDIEAWKAHRGVRFSYLPTVHLADMNPIAQRHLPEHFNP